VLLQKVLQLRADLETLIMFHDDQSVNFVDVLTQSCRLTPTVSAYYFPFISVYFWTQFLGTVRKYDGTCQQDNRRKRSFVFLIVSNPHRRFIAIPWNDVRSMQVETEKLAFVT
jgi:hypothetical protein